MLSKHIAMRAYYQEYNTFIDDDTIGIDRLNADMKAEWYARQKIHGIINLETGVACETDVASSLQANLQSRT